MILPTARWFRVAAALALLAPLALWRAEAATLLVVANVLWVAALVIDAVRSGDVPLNHFPVTRESPPAFSVGRALPVHYDWTNETSRPLTLEVREEWPEPFGLVDDSTRTLTVAPHTMVRETRELVATRRGRSAGGRLALRLMGPWRLAWRQGNRLLPWTVTVYPDLRNAALRALPTQAQRRREAGFRNLRRLGEGRSFESLREWSPGDDSRAIDWKATARRGHLVTRQYEDERRQHVMMLIDAGRMLTAEIDGRSRLESAIDAALELAHSAVRHDDDIGLLVFADEILAYVPPARGRRALRQVLEGLSTIEGRLVEPHYPAAFAYLASKNRRRALSVLFTDVIDRTASEALVSHASSLRPRHLPLAVTLRDPALDLLATARPTSETGAFERAAAEELLGAREAALAEMRGRGLLVLDTLPDRAAKAVVEQYERLKRRALV
jgi:uncharacterized protein (DUF58 family)